MDKELRFDSHLKKMVHQASLRVSALRRVSGHLDRQGILLLYKAQIRPYLEYAGLTWMSCAGSYKQKLERIERHAMRLVEDPNLPNDQAPPILDSLEHRRDVASLVVFHNNKAQIQRVPHLARLRLPPRVNNRSTRTVLSTEELVEVPRSQSSQHQRTYPSRVARLWNLFTAAVPSVREMTTQQVKVAAHKWRGTLPTPLLLLAA